MLCKQKGKKMGRKGPENYDARVSLGVLYNVSVQNIHTEYIYHLSSPSVPLPNQRPLTESVQIYEETRLAMAFHPTTILTPFLALLSLYAAQKSYIAITNLQRYEERTEKAAKHLDKAAHDLYKTRITQASGVAAVRTHLSPQRFHSALLLKSSNRCLVG